MAMPNSTSNAALPRAVQRGQMPRISATPRKNSAAVAAQARNGIVEARHEGIYLGGVAHEADEISVADVAAAVEAEAIGDAGKEGCAERDAGVENCEALQSLGALVFGGFVRSGLRCGVRRVGHDYFSLSGLLSGTSTLSGVWRSQTK